jgi:ganglioside-induced differentiation-associated protein 1
MSELVLYDFGNSVCCQKVRITLRAKGLEWKAIRVDLFTAAQYDPNYLKLNPKGVVPTLVHDGKPVIESTLICEYIDQTFPQPPKLIPADPALQARMRLWSKMVDEGLFDGVTELSFSAMFRERMRNMPEEIRQARFRNVGDPRRTDRFKSTYEHGVQSPFVVHAVAAYERAFKLLEATLARGGPWILGGEPSLADINLMPFAARLDYLGLLDLWTRDRPRVQAWWAHAGAWPYFKSGLYDLITETEFAEMRTHGPKIRDGIAAHLDAIRQGIAASAGRNAA